MYSIASVVVAIASLYLLFSTIHPPVDMRFFMRCETLVHVLIKQFASFRHGIFFSQRIYYCFGGELEKIPFRLKGGEPKSLLKTMINSK